MSPRQLVRAAALVVALAALPGCGPGCAWMLGLRGGGWSDGADADDDSNDRWGDDDEDEEWDSPPIVALTIDAAGDVMGPEDTVSVFVDDDESATLDVTVEFARVVDRSANSGETLTLTGASLGEGWGTLFVDVVDDDGGFTTASAWDLLVDLTPPALELEPCILSATGEGERGRLGAWVGDAWALGAVEVAVGDDVVAADAFPDWPATFGETWDWSWVSVSATELPVGRNVATFTATDRAGNVTRAACDLFVDAAPPLVTLAATLVEGAVHVEVGATDDDEALPGALVLYAGGAEVAHGQAPSTSFALDAADFPSGALALQAAARDRAGNEGRSAVVVVTLP